MCKSETCWQTDEITNTNLLYMNMKKNLYNYLDYKNKPSFLLNGIRQSALTIVSLSSRTWSYSLREARKMREVTFSKQ